MTVTREDLARRLRCLALASVAFAVVAGIVRDVPPGASAGALLLVALTVLAAMAVASGLVWRAATATVLRERDLLVPVCLRIGLATALSLLERIPWLRWLAEPLGTLPVFGIQLGLSPEWLALLSLDAACALWTTRLVLAAAADGPVALVESMRFAKRDVARTAAACLVAGFLPIVVLGAVQTLCVVSGFLETGIAAIVAAFLGLFAFILTWNLLTATWLLDVVGSDAPLSAQSRRSFVAGLRPGPRLLFPVLAQMLLLGGHRLTWTSEPGSWNASYNVNFAWTGAYPDNVRWLDDAASAWKVPVLHSAAALLTVAAAVVAVAVRLHVARRLAALRAPEGEERPGPGADQAASAPPG